jgi:hypothetical protein
LIYLEALMSTIMFGGSRSLPVEFFDLVAQVVGASLSAGSGVSVGCAAGADAAVLAAACRVSPSAVQLFALGSSSGAGFWSGSAPFAWLARAAALGARVVWSAGGSSAVPFRARLLRRSLAALAVADAAVFFLASPSSPGSLRVAAAAAGAGLPVFAFACGFSGSPAPLAGCSGSWVPGSFRGFSCFSWAPAVAQPALF